MEQNRAKQKQQLFEEMQSKQQSREVTDDEVAFCANPDFPGWSYVEVELKRLVDEGKFESREQALAAAKRNPFFFRQQELIRQGHPAFPMNVNPAELAGWISQTPKYPYDEEISRLYPNRLRALDLIVDDRQADGSIPSYDAFRPDGSPMGQPLRQLLDDKFNSIAMDLKEIPMVVPRSMHHLDVGGILGLNPFDHSAARSGRATMFSDRLQKAPVVLGKYSENIRRHADAAFIVARSQGKTDPEMVMQVVRGKRRLPPRSAVRVSFDVETNLTGTKFADTFDGMGVVCNVIDSDEITHAERNLAAVKIQNSSLSGSFGSKHRATGALLSLKHTTVDQHDTFLYNPPNRAERRKKKPKRHGEVASVNKVEVKTSGLLKGMMKIVK